MTRFSVFRRAFRANVRGATAIEFAIVAPVLLVLILGLSEVCYQAYTTAILSGAIQKAGRDSTLETGSGAQAATDASVLAAVQQIAKNATYTVVRKSYSTFAAVKPEDYTDTNGNGVRDPTECYTNSNNNGSYDVDGGKTGLGGADDVVVYTITVNYPHIFPFTKFLGGSNTAQIQAKTVLKNQPFANQNVPTPVTRCTP